MIYGFPQYFESKSRFLTYTVVASALKKAGHTVTDDVDNCDAVLFSMCDVMDYTDLVKMRGRTDKPLIVGGSYAFNFRSAILYCDMVWIGEIYEFADCKSLAEISDSASCYLGDNSKKLIASLRIDWDKVPVCQIAPKKCYYWGGVGCKNKCRFCFTSWTHKHNINDKNRIAQAKEEAKNRKLFLNICSNEYEDADGGKTMDMMLKDYIKTPVSGASMVRLGIEFATEETRLKNGKHITDDMLYASIQKMNIDNVTLRFFHIAGYDSLEDWNNYIDILCKMVDRHPNKRLLHLMFNNLQYQNYTPLYDERKNINPENYIDVTNTKAWFDKMRQHSRHVLIGAPSPFQHVACRMGIEGATEKGQIDFWLSKIKSAKRKMTKDEAYKALFDTGVLETEKLRFDFKTGAIIKG